MKKTFALVAFLAILLVACGDSDEQSYVDHCQEVGSIDTVGCINLRDKINIRILQDMKSRIQDKKAKAIQEMGENGYAASLSIVDEQISALTDDRPGFFMSFIKGLHRGQLSPLADAIFEENPMGPGAGIIDESTHWKSIKGLVRQKIGIVPQASQIAVATVIPARPISPGSPSASEFVQHFYDWYGPLTSAPENKEDVRAVLKDQPEVFDQALATSLAADANAQSSADGEEGGLDYDPFVNAQDTCGQQQRFDVGKEIEGPSEATVEVYATCDGKKETTPRVLVSLLRHEGKWVFSDFGTLADPHQLTRALNAKKANSTSEPGDVENSPANENPAVTPQGSK